MGVKYWRIEEFDTQGWTVAPNAPNSPSTKLTKEQAKVRLEELLAEGSNPNRLRAVPDS